MKGAIVRARYSTYGLVDLRTVGKINQERLDDFDTKFLAKCHVWLAGDMSSTDITSVKSFFKEYDIPIKSRQGSLTRKKNPNLALGYRISSAIAVDVQSPENLSHLSYVYWATLLDVLCFRGLQYKL